MTAVWLVVRAGLRSRWRSWLALAVVAGLAGGLVTVVAAGARRTDAAYPALVAWSDPPDDEIAVGPNLGQTFANVAAARVRKLPQVTSAGAFDGFGALVPASVAVIAPVDGAVPGDLWHRKLLVGTLPDPGNPAAADVSFTVAQAQHVTVGGTLSITLLGAGNKPFLFNFRVAGIEAAPGEFPPQYGTGIDTRVGDPRLRQGVRHAAAHRSRARGAVARRRRGRVGRGERNQPPGRRQAGQRLPAGHAGDQHPAHDPPAGCGAVAARRGACAAWADHPLAAIVPVHGP